MVKSKIVYQPRELTFKEKRMIVKAHKVLFSDYKEAISKSINAKNIIMSNHSIVAYKKNLRIILDQDL